MIDLHAITPLAVDEKLYSSLQYGGLFLPFSDDIILMQFTGLLDKNGKEIYEGDVLTDEDGYLLEVKFGKLPLRKSGDCVCTYESFYAQCHGKLGVAPMYACQEIGTWMKIIGNIHENPDLVSPLFPHEKV